MSRVTEAFTLDNQGDGGYINWAWGGYFTQEGGQITSVPQPPLVNCITLYTDVSYGGLMRNLPVGQYPYLGDAINDQVSSLQVPAGFNVTLFADAGFQGQSESFSQDGSVGAGFNDVTSSVIVKFPGIPLPPPPPPPPSRGYVIQPGDTLIKLAERFYGDWSQWTRIRDANPGIDPDNLQIGQTINIPMAAPTTMLSPRQYTVAAEDTLAKIAARFLNNGARCVEIQKPDGTSFTEQEAADLQIGQVVLIPRGLS